MWEDFQICISVPLNQAIGISCDYNLQYKLIASF